MTLQQIQVFLAELLGYNNPSDITPTTSFSEDLQMDANEYDELVVHLEDTYGIEASDDKIVEFEMIEDLVEFIVLNAIEEDEDDNLTL